METPERKRCLCKIALCQEQYETVVEVIDDEHDVHIIEVCHKHSQFNELMGKTIFTGEVIINLAKKR